MCKNQFYDFTKIDITNHEPIFDNMFSEYDYLYDFPQDSVDSMHLPKKLSWKPCPKTKLDVIENERSIRKGKENKNKIIKKRARNKQARKTKQKQKL
jgi:hypothetical protein